MRHERDPQTLPFAQAIMESFGKGYKPPVRVTLMNDDFLNDCYVIGAGPDWIKVSGQDLSDVHYIPVGSIVMVSVKK